MKKYIALLLALTVALPCFAACKAEEGENGGVDKDVTSEEAASEEAASEESAVSAESAEDIIEEENNLRYHTKTYWLKDTAGELIGTEIIDGALCLSQGKKHGSFTAELDVGTFRTMLASWNSVTNGGRVEMAVSFEVEDSKWSKYFSWGVWSSREGVSGSEDTADEYGSIDIDILTVKSGHAATGKVKVKLSLAKGVDSPKVYNFSLTTPEMEKQQVVDSAALPKEALNDVPMRSQLSAENGADGNRICSPTTVVMALDYMGTTLPTMTAAKGVYDNGWKAYGNWSYAVAYAGEQGYIAYMDLYDRDMMKYALSQGYVIGCSTYLTSSGHLVLVVGYTVIDGVEYYIVNDPNVNPDKVERTNYTVEYFEDRWFRDSMEGYGVVYVFAGK